MWPRPDRGIGRREAARASTDVHNRGAILVTRPGWRVRTAVSATSNRVYERIRATVWDADEGDDLDEAIARLPPDELAVYATRALEDELAEGGWSLIFGNDRQNLLAPAIEGYERMGLARHAALARAVVEAGDGLPVDDLLALDERFARLRGAEAARARFIKAQGLDREPRER